MKRIFSLAGLIALPGIASALDLSGDWKIDSSVGGTTPIVVNCTLVQSGDKLTGHCTPVMANAEPAELTGTATAGSAVWAYDVVFNGNPGHIEFEADAVSDDAMSGTLMLSGTPAPFTAARTSTAAR